MREKVLKIFDLTNEKMSFEVLLLFEPKYSRKSDILLINKIWIFLRFTVDTDILIGGYGLFGGRGEYVGKIKLFDLGR